MLFQMKHLPMIRQAESTECGHACLAMIAGWHGHQIDLVSLRLHQTASSNGTSLHSLAVLAEQFSLRARALRLEPADLGRVALPAILHWDMNHFVVLKSVDRRGAVIHDPGRGVLRLSLKDMGQHFTGVAMEFQPTEAFKPIRQERRLPLLSLFRGVEGLGRRGAQVIALSLFFEVLLLMAPWYLQIAVDNVIPSGDTQLSDPEPRPAPDRRRCRLGAGPRRRRGDLAARRRFRAERRPGFLDRLSRPQCRAGPALH